VRYPAGLPAIGLAAGIAVAIFLHLSLHPAVLVFLSSAAAVGFCLRRDRLTCGLLALGFFTAGIILGRQSDVQARATPLGKLFAAHVDADRYQLSGEVTGMLKADALNGPAGVTLNVRVETVKVDGITYEAAGGALVGVGGAPREDQIAQWRGGRRISFPATLRRPARYLDPGVADGERQLAWRGSSLVGSVKSERLVTIVSAGSRVNEATAAVRHAVRRAVHVSVGVWGVRSAAIVTAILIGDRAGLDAEAERQLQEAGTYHVIAISGGNIAILAALGIVLLRALRIGSRAATAIMIAMLPAYAIVVEGGSSVSRATLMAAIYFAARLCDHGTRPVNVAALTAAVLLYLEPLQLFDAGFALTFGAALAIIIGVARLERIETPRPLRPFTTIVAASICAEIALLPVNAFVFSRVTFAGLLINLAAIPLMTVVQIAGLVSVALAWCGADVARFSGWIAHAASEGLVRSAGFVEIVPALVHRVPPPAPAIIAAYYLSLCATLVSRRHVLWLAVAACAFWIVAAPAPAFGGEPWLRVTFLDVGQGDAAVVQFPNGRALGIDAGGLSGNAFDIGGRVVAPALWSRGVRRLDYLSVSHGDDDHIGGALSVFRDFRPREVWEGVPVPPHKPTQELRAVADASGATWRTVHPNDTLHVREVDVFVRHPPHPDWERQRVRNDDSEVIEIRYGGVSIVFTGDIGREAERQIAGSFAPAAVRILKVPHHGSATSSSAAFLDALQPDVAVISAGRGNPFGHPAGVVLDRYRAAGASIYRTDLDGAVSVETDGMRVKVVTYTGRKLTLTTFGR
jgi:competence protein ComEC